MDSGESHGLRGDQLVIRRSMTGGPSLGWSDGFFRVACRAAVGPRAAVMGALAEDE